jgi:phage baseplate assembly protein V
MRELIDAIVRDALAPYIDRIAELENEVNDLHRRARNQGRRGVVVAVDYGKGLCKVKHGGNTTPWIRWASASAGEVSEWRPPSVGEGCELINHGGGNDSGQSIAVPGIPTAAYPPAGSSGTQHRLTYKDGTSWQYDFAAHRYEWTNGQTSIVHDREAIVFMRGGNGIRIDESGVHVIGSGLDHNGKNVGEDHKHDGIQPGPAQTGEPV